MQKSYRELCPCSAEHPGVTCPAFKVPADIGAGQKEGPSLCW